MVALIIGMLVCVALAVAVVAAVAIPARREGREVLTPQGEELISAARDKAREKTESALEKTSDALSTAKDKVSDSVASVGSGSTPEDSGRHRAG
jgi:hypothetical protein